MSVYAELRLVGARRGGHTFYVNVEGGSGYRAVVDGQEVEQAYLRAACSCGWREPGAVFTLEENAHASWVYHVRMRDQ